MKNMLLHRQHFEVPRQSIMITVPIARWSLYSTMEMEQRGKQTWCQTVGVQSFQQNKFYYVIVQMFVNLSKPFPFS